MNLSFTLPTVGSSVSTARHRVAEHLTDIGCPTNRIIDATIAVSEAVTNAVVHAYHPGDGDVHVNVNRPDAKTVNITVRDTGRGPMPSLATMSPSGCLGFPLMAELADCLTVEGSRDNGTTITLTFPL